MQRSFVEGGVLLVEVHCRRLVCGKFSIKTLKFSPGMKGKNNKAAGRTDWLFTAIRRLLKKAIYFIAGYMYSLSNQLHRSILNSVYSGKRVLLFMAVY